MDNLAAAQLLLSKTEKQDEWGLPLFSWYKQSRANLQRTIRRALFLRARDREPYMLTEWDALNTLRSIYSHDCPYFGYSGLIRLVLHLGAPLPRLDCIPPSYNMQRIEEDKNSVAFLKEMAETGAWSRTETRPGSPAEIVEEIAWRWFEIEGE